MANVPLVSNPILPPVPDEPRLNEYTDQDLQDTFDKLWKWMKDVSVQLKILFGSPQASNSALTLPLVQAGSLIPFAGPTNIPAGYLSCDGSVVSQTQYAALFSAIGANWNTGGEGAGNFRLPDLRGRVVLGAGPGNGSTISPRTVAQLGGEENHVLTAGELAAHSHGNAVTDPGHTHTISADGAHSHTNRGVSAPGSFLTGGGGFPISDTQTPGSHSHGGATGIPAAGGGGSTGITVAITATGLNTPHNNMQPFGVILWIIKF